MKRGSIYIFSVVIICLLYWEYNQGIGGKGSLGCQKGCSSIRVMAAATEQNVENATKSAVSAYMIASDDAVKVGDLVCIDYIYYKITASSAAKRTVCVIGFDEEATKLCFVNYVVIKGVRYDITEIDSYAFFGCEMLHSKVELGNYVKTVGDYAFYGCINITEISVGTQVKSIGQNSFYGCKHVKKIYLQKANSLKKIGNRAFYEISSKAKIYYKKKNVGKLLKSKYNQGKLVQL